MYPAVLVIGDSRSDVVVGVMECRRQIRRRGEREFVSPKRSNYYTGPVDPFNPLCAKYERHERCRSERGEEESRVINSNNGKGKIINCRHGLRVANIR